MCRPRRPSFTLGPPEENHPLSRSPSKSCSQIAVLGERVSGRAKSTSEHRVLVMAARGTAADFFFLPSLLQSGCG